MKRTAEYYDCKLEDQLELDKRICESRKTGRRKRNSKSGKAKKRYRHLKGSEKKPLSEDKNLTFDKDLMKMQMNTVKKYYDEQAGNEETGIEDLYAKKYYLEKKEKESSKAGGGAFLIGAAVVMAFFNKEAVTCLFNYLNSISFFSGITDWLAAMGLSPEMLTFMESIAGALVSGILAVGMLFGEIKIMLNYKNKKSNEQTFNDYIIKEYEKEYINEIIAKTGEITEELSESSSYMPVKVKEIEKAEESVYETAAVKRSVKKKKKKSHVKMENAKKPKEIDKRLKMAMEY